MRGLLEGQPTPAPLTDLLPALLREDAFAARLCTGLDEVLTPVLVSLDCFAAYLDVTTVPDDMLPWLGQWLGISLDPRQDPEAQRELLALARELHALRGTAAGVALAVRATLGIDVTVSETGASGWSAAAGAILPGEALPRVVITLASAPDELDRERLEAVVRSALPAHVRFRIQEEGVARA